MPASMLVFIDWPPAPLAVRLDGERGLCRGASMEYIDLKGIFEWNDGRFRMRDEEEAAL